MAAALRKQLDMPLVVICPDDSAADIMRRDLEAAFCGFICDPLVMLSVSDARKLFDEMVDNTAKYLTEYKR